MIFWILAIIGYFGIGVLLCVVDKSKGVLSRTFLWPLELMIISSIWASTKFEKLVVNGFKNSINETINYLQRSSDGRVKKYVNPHQQKRLTVIIYGFSGTGKTLVARQIEEFLVNKGYECDRVPDDDEMSWNISQEQQKTDDLQEGGLEILIKTVQLKRGLKNKENDQIHDYLAEMGEVNLGLDEY
jgi:type II secretory pathway predicted ATPase ExeA